MIALRRAVGGGGGVRQFCELDRWSFDPRYTDGRCPICGWRPDGASSAPRWLALARRVEWQLLGLVALLVVLVVLGLVVARAAGMAVPLPQAQRGGGSAAAAPGVSAPMSTASPSGNAAARVHGTKSPDR